LCREPPIRTVPPPSLLPRPTVSSLGMDIKLHRPQSVCSRTGHGFTAGESFVSALVRAAGGLTRLDIADEAWDGPPPDTIAWWRSRYPSPGATGPTLAPVEVLLDALESLEGDSSVEPLRYLLALQLVRRRVLRVLEQHAEPPQDGVWHLACRRRERDYRVRIVSATDAADPAVAARLDALLWSGDAA